MESWRPTCTHVAEVSGRYVNRTAWRGKPERAGAPSPVNLIQKQSSPMAGVSTPEAVYADMVADLASRLHKLTRQKERFVDLLSLAKGMVMCTECKHTRCIDCRTILLPSGEVNHLCGICCKLAQRAGNSTEVNYCAVCCVEP